MKVLRIIPALLAVGCIATLDIQPVLAQAEAKPSRPVQVEPKPERRDQPKPKKS